MTPIPPPHHQLHAYNALTAFFTQHQGTVLEISILPPGFELDEAHKQELFVYEGTDVGIPKKTLVLAYLEARRRLFECREGGDVEEKDIHPTTIILLLDPEHLTAANQRKRFLLHHEDSFLHKDLVFREFVFLTTILTSPLHRQSKSPTLWSHRYWLYTRFHSILCPISPSLSNLAFLSEEIKVVSKSGERHPKNYYAWQYGRRLLSSTGTMDSQIISTMRQWCQRNPSDISGWSFLLFLLTQPKTDGEVRESIVREVVEYAVKVRLENESVWGGFVRGALALDGVGARLRVELRGLLKKEKVGSENGEDGVFWGRVKETVEWTDKVDVDK